MGKKIKDAQFPDLLPLTKEGIKMMSKQATEYICKRHLKGLLSEIHKHVFWG
jgi:hypothetical protein